MIVEGTNGFVHGLFTYGEIQFYNADTPMPTHEIPTILFGVQNRVSYKSRQVKNSTMNSYYGYTSYFKATLHEDLYNPDWQITSDL